MILKIIAGAFLISGILFFIQGYALIADRAQDAGKEKLSLDGGTVEIRMRAVKDEWRFEPNEVSIPAGSAATLRIFNEDSYAHGFAIKELGIDKNLPPLKETIVELTDIKPGRYEFFCSVLCGKGHFDQKGILVVH
jgi:cytochrome c oxidase subunit 2